MCIMDNGNDPPACMPFLEISDKNMIPTNSGLIYRTLRNDFNTLLFIIEINCNTSGETGSTFTSHNIEMKLAIHTTPKAGSITGNTSKHISNSPGQGSH